jgi:hypothetical protein
MILVIWLLNAVISAFNAWGCGKSWRETRHVGGIPHALNWCGAIMAASGFTWCYLVIIATVGANWQVEQSDGTMAAYLTAEQLTAFCQLGYLLIIGPILGSGLAITVHAWRVAWERRTLGSGAVAAWDTFAMVYNFSSAFRHVPTALDGVGGFFKGSDDGKGKVVVLVLLAAVAGIVTTYLIIHHTAKTTALNRGFRIRNRLEDLGEARA